MQSDIALHLHGSDDEDPGRDENRAAAVLIAGVDGGLQGLRGERYPIAFSAEIEDVIGAGAKGVGSGCWGGVKQKLN